MYIPVLSTVLCVYVYVVLGGGGGVTCKDCNHLCVRMFISSALCIYRYVVLDVRV